MRSKNYNSKVTRGRHIAMRCAMLVGFGAVLAVMPAEAIISANSSTWEGSYEGNALPYNGGAGPFAINDSSGGTEATAASIISVTGEPGNNALHLTPVGGNLFYNPTNDVAFDFATGVSVEMRIQSYFGNAGQSSLVWVDDAFATRSFILSFRYSNANPGGQIDLAGAVYPFPLSVVDGFHTIRATALGNVLSLYVDYNDTPVLTTTPFGFLGGFSSPNKHLAFGNQIITSDFDYIRWTTEGAFAQIPEPSSVGLLALAGLLVLRKHRKS